MNNRELFLRHVAQTSPSPLALEIVKAEGALLIDAAGKEYIDLIGGIAVANTGHRHPKVIEAIRQQTDAYLHVMVYGEFIESPEVQYAQLLTRHLPATLDTVYFTNSGAEAVEGAMKLVKKATGRQEIIAFENSYHGSTQGALSIMGSEYWRNAFRPLLPGITHVAYNSFASLDAITQDTAAIFVETIQAEAGIIIPDKKWIKALREKCSQTETLLILDEIQAAFGRTGTLWGFEQFEIIPDVLLLGKALGGGMPLGAFITGKKLMGNLAEDPVLGHITTFGGHPVCCAAGMAAMKALLEEEMMSQVKEKAALFLYRLSHPSIKAIRSNGLWISLQFDSFETNKKVIDYCIANGILTDWFLFAPDCLRLSPPLVISKEQIEKACAVIMEGIRSV